jgi:hypothetical protein
MRHLTAGQKIAQLENRIAELEKEAIFGFGENTLESKFDKRGKFYVTVDTRGNSSQPMDMGDAIKSLLSSANPSTPYEIRYNSKSVSLFTDYGVDVSIHIEPNILRVLSRDLDVDYPEEASLGSFKKMAATIKKSLKKSTVKRASALNKQAGLFGPSPYEKTVSKLPYPYEIRVRDAFDPSSPWQPIEGQEGAIYKALDDLHAQKALQGGVLELSDANYGFGFVLENKTLSYPPYIMWVKPSKQMMSVTGNIYTDSLVQHKTHMKALKERAGKYLKRKGYKVKVI